MTILEFKQLELFNAQSEAELFHNCQRAGFFSLLVANGAEKQQSSHPLLDMPRILSLVDQSKDTWLSQAEFCRPNRRVVNLARIGLLFADLDTYKEAWARGKTPEQQSDALIHFCESEGIPSPSIVIFSGRGLQAKWLLDTALPRQALPRWNACQRELVDRLSMIGADQMAKDASRVLRLVNTVNTKSGEIVRPVYVHETDGRPTTYSFDYLAEHLLPLSREQLQQNREEAARKRQERADKRQLRLIQGDGNKSGLRRLSGRQLAWDRLDDLRTLAVLRGGVREGERMLSLFWQINFLLLSGATNPQQMFFEAEALARQIDPSWWRPAYRSELSTLLSKGKQFAAGEMVEYNGKSYPALYTPKNDHLIDLFRISEEEQSKLKTIISTDIAAARHRKRDEVRRRAAGAIERAEYEANAISKQKPWEALGMSRAKWYRMGKPTSQ